MSAATSTAKAPVMSNKAKVIGLLAATLIRIVSGTLRWRLDDKAGVTTDPPEGQMIWAFWHNRIFAVPVMYRKFLRSRRGAVLTSPSKDGAIIASTVSQFGVDSVRGSSSRGGLRALLALKKWIDDGYDVAITPDGPRGPRYQLAPGMVMLAQKTGASVLPVRVEYSSYWRLKSWDQFQIPKPFSKVAVTFEPLQTVASDVDEEAFEAARAEIQDVLNPDGETE